MARLSRSLSQLLYLLAAAVTVSGVAALFVEASRIEPWSLGLQDFADSVSSNAIAWLAAAAWLVCALSARWLASVSLRKRARVEIEPSERPMVNPDASDPALHSRRGSVARLRLEALMRGDEPETAAFIDQAVAMAVEAGASDIHLQPTGPEASVTFRTRGELREVAHYPANRHADVVRRLKVLAELPPYITAKPQDGRLALDTPHGKVDIRLSTVPAQDGERVALRLAGEAETRSLASLGLLAEDLERFTALLQEPQGMIVLTGPTGCGKTTTLYSALHQIHSQRGRTTSIASIEDPVEVDLPFIHQVPVDRARGISFAGALRSVLRQDPNVLMVGEIRDSETAKTAVQAGLSGHLILTTLHAESTLGVFPRLIDLGVEPFLAASASLACVSQRLLRRLCPECRHPRSTSPEERQRLKPLGFEKAQFFTAEGCATCDRRGTDGRVAVFELLYIDSELRRLLTARASHDQLVEAALAKDSVFFDRSALKLATTGEIGLDEALRLGGGLSKAGTL